MIEALRRFSVCTLSDALDTIGIDGGCGRLRGVGSAFRCIGPAYTVSFEPVNSVEVGAAADYIDEVPAGSVIVLDNAGRLDCTVWGGLLTEYALRHGIAGTVIYGCCRDTAEIRRREFPVFSSGLYMKSGKNRVRMKTCNQPIDIVGTTIHPGDIVSADDDGVLAIPLDSASQVLSLAREIHEMETRILEDVASGTDLRVARARYGYQRFAKRRAQSQ